MRTECFAWIAGSERTVAGHPHPAAAFKIDETEPGVARVGCVHVGVEEYVVVSMVVTVNIAADRPPMTERRTVIVVVRAVEDPHLLPHVVTNLTDAVHSFGPVQDALAPYAFDVDAARGTCAEFTDPLVGEVSKHPNDDADSEGDESLIHA